MTPQREEFQGAFEKFLEVAQNKIDEYMVQNFPTLSVPKLVTEVGQKNIRVVKSGEGVQRSVYCFVEISTGNILKAASWKTPAKGSRGNIFSSDHGASAVTAYGAIYFK